MPAEPPEPLAPLDLPSLVPVSRETIERLKRYLELLGEWQTRMNLVGASTMADPWRRHILDSLQLLPLLPEGTRRLVDLGSGAGLPGLILAIAGVPAVVLIESERRKAAFLREVARELGVGVKVHASRLQAVRPFAADVVTARALAPLDELLGLAGRFAGPRTVGLFLKGRAAEAELTAARRQWTMKVEQHRSLSDPEGQVLIIRGWQRVGNV
jgi:16S rRNA (guanine527-N7)-methyltransferase